MLLFILLTFIYNTYAFSYGNIAIIGSTGKLGINVINNLSKKNISTTILNRHSYKLNNYTNFNANSKLIKYYSSLSNIKIIDGDINDEESLIKLLEDCDTCLALHGSTRISKFTDIFNYNINDKSHPMYVNYIGIHNIITAAKKTKRCKHIIRVTGNGENPWSFPSIIINLFSSMSKPWNYAGEYLLRNSNISYTIIRPGIMSYDNDKDYSLEISDNGKYIPISKISYDNIGKLCIECITHPNVKNSTLTAMTVSTGYGKSSWKQLLSNVKSDIRFYPDKKDIITKHYIAVNILLVILITTLLNIIKILFNI